MKNSMQIKITANQDYSEELDTLKSQTLRDLVEKFLQLTFIKVNYVLTDGFEGHDIQINFSPTKRSFVAHDLLALDLDDLTAIADFFKSASSMPGFSCELHSVDQGEFALIVGIG